MSASDPRVSVVLPCYNGEPHLAHQLEALAAQEWDGAWEVIVADNGSTDGSRAVVERYRDRLPSLRLIDASDRRAEPHARNVGVRASRGVAIVFCDADDVAAPGWLRAMASALADGDAVACAMDVEKLNEPWVQASHGNFQISDLQQIAYPPFYRHAGGFSLGVRRAVFDAVGGFDEGLPYLCDTDFCFRVQLAGFSLSFVPDAVMHYRYRDTFGGLFKQAVNWADHNVLLYKRYRTVESSAMAGWATWARRWRAVAGIARRRPTRANRARLCWLVGWQVGLLRGAVRHHVAPGC